MSQDSLGMVKVTTPGTPVRATSNRADPTEPFHVHAYTIQRLESSSGKIYVQMSSSDIRTTKTKMLAELSKSLPAWGAGIVNEGNSIDLSQVYLDADVPNDGVIIAILEH